MTMPAREHNDQVQVYDTRTYPTKSFSCMELFKEKKADVATPNVKILKRQDSGAVRKVTVSASPVDLNGMMKNKWNDPKKWT